MASDQRFARAHLAGGGRVGQFDGEAQHALVTAAQQGQQAVRGDAADGFGKVEPVAELGAFGLFAFDHGRDDAAALVKQAAQGVEQGGVFAELFDQNLAGAVECGLGVGNAGLGVEVACGLGLGR